MFFSNEILTKKGGQFAVVWLVGNFNTVHGSKRLGLKKSDYVSVDIVKACDDMLNPRTQFALRLSATLLMGIIRIYQKQITVVYDEVKSMWIFIKKGSFLRPENVELQNMSRSETFALPNPLFNYDSELGNKESDIRFYTSLGEKALFEAPKESHESRADSAYFTISFGDQQITGNEEYENTMIEIREESPAKRRKVSKDSFLDIIEDESTPLKIREKPVNIPIEVPGDIDFAPTDMPMFDITKDNLDREFAEYSQLGADSGLLTDMTDPTLEYLNFAPLLETSDLSDAESVLPAIPEDQMITDQQIEDHPPLPPVKEEPIQENLEQSVQLELLQPEVEQPPLQENMETTIEQTAADETALDKTAEQPTEETENRDPNQSRDIGEMVINELANRIENEPLLQLDDENKENMDPNVRRRSQRKLMLAKDKAFDTSLGSFTLPEITTPRDVPTKRKRKRHLVVDKSNQLSVKEMKKFMKNSRQHLCAEPRLVHKIVPDPAKLLGAPHRSYISRVPELHKLWKRCAHSGTHDLMELLQHQLGLDELEKENIPPQSENVPESENVSESSRKRPRSSVLSEVGRFGDNTTFSSDVEIGRFSRGSDGRRDSTVSERTLDDSATVETATGFRTSTVLKPERGSGILTTLLSPIQQLNGLEDSDLSLQPKRLLPIMEDSSNMQPELETTISVPQESAISAPESTMFGEQPESTMFGEQPESTMFGQHDSNMLGQITEMEMEIAHEEPPNISLIERPRTPLIERLSGAPDTILHEEDMAKFRHFPSRENQKFFRFVEKKFEGGNEIGFEDLVPLNHTKKTAALAFYQLLLLKKFKHVDVSQADDVDYGKISIKLS